MMNFDLSALVLCCLATPSHAIENAHRSGAFFHIHIELFSCIYEPSRAVPFYPFLSSGGLIKLLHLQSRMVVQPPLVQLLFAE